MRTPLRAQVDDVEDGREADAPSAPATSPSPAMPALATPVQAALILGTAGLAYYLVALAGGPQAVLKEVQELTSDGGVGAALVFSAAYIAATVLLLPGSLLTLAAGYIFGPLAGTAIVSAASTSGAAAAFLISRYLARPWVTQKLQAYPRFGAIDKAIGAQGGRIVLLLRLSPLFPFSLLNYGLGLTGVGFWPYLGASWLGMLPATFAYVYLGGAGKAAVDAGTSGEVDPVKASLYAVGAVATILATRYIAKAASSALDEAANDDSASDGSSSSS